MKFRTFFEQTSLHEQLKKINQQDAIDNKFFGPVYHGTTAEKMSSISDKGFQIFTGNERSGEISHGYQSGNYSEGVPPPIHHLGYGIYFTTVKNIAKGFSYGNSLKFSYYLNVPRLETINFGAPRTMMKWWIENGYNPELAKTDRVAATMEMTNKLKSRYDAVWFKGKGIRSLLDGDQIVVFDPNNIYMVDPSLADPYKFDVGSKVRRKSDGMIGIVKDKQNIEGHLQKFPGASSWLNPKTKYKLYVTWKKGGTDYNVQDVDVEPVVKR